MADLEQCAELRGGHRDVDLEIRRIALAAVPRRIDVGHRPDRLGLVASAFLPALADAQDARHRFQPAAGGQGDRLALGDDDLHHQDARAALLDDEPRPGRLECHDGHASAHDSAGTALLGRESTCAGPWARKQLQCRLRAHGDAGPSSGADVDALFEGCGVGAGSRNRTHDQRFTKPLLYQLSYAGDARDSTRAGAERVAIGRKESTPTTHARTTGRNADRHGARRASTSTRPRRRRQKLRRASVPTATPSFGNREVRARGYLLRAMWCTGQGEGGLARRRRVHAHSGTEASDAEGVVAAVRETPRAT